LDNLNETKIKELSFKVADKIYFSFINNLNKSEREKFVIDDLDNTDEKGQIVGTKNTELGIEVFDEIENTIIDLLEKRIF
tara:strand:- start:226 stop:465 length:240 start_codon:yes stop_codon:yes gene_type:complete